MTNVFDAAKYILQARGPLTILKLEKLCYYAQAWSLAWQAEELFADEFEAWPNGPVCVVLYNWNRGRRRVAAADIPDDLLSGEEFSAGQIGTLDAVLREYSENTGQWLAELAYMEDPWRHARRGLAPGMHCRRVISKGDIACYYASL